MYSSGYSHVSRHSPQAQKKMQYRSKGKSCGYYMRIVFFFSSLIQSLIIVSLVLFLIYGKKQDSASVSRIQDLEESFSRLSIDNVALRQQRKNLTNLLNATMIEKARNDWDLATLLSLSNTSAVLIQDIDRKLRQCHEEVFLCRSRAALTGNCPQIQTGGCNCGMLVEQLKARHDLVESNFTQTTQRMRREMDLIARDRDNFNLQVISLKRDKFTHEKEVEFCRQKCKEDFAHSLSGVSNVTKAFLRKVDSLFPTHIAFQLTCPKQREHLEQIRTNCSSLSREVEDRFQNYLNLVGEQVSTIQSENSRLKAENWRLSDDYRWCSQNRTGLIQQHRQNLDKMQRKHDEEKEKLLMEKMRLSGEIQVLDNNVKYKSKETEHIKEQLKQLNMTCMSKAVFAGSSGGLNTRSGTSPSGWGLLGGAGGGGSSSSLGGGLGRTGSGLSFGSAFNKPSTGSSGSTGLGLNKLGSTGLGSSSTSLSSSGSSSSTGLGLNKLGSSGTGSSSTSLFSGGSSGSTGLGLNRLGSTGLGSSSTSLLSSGSSSSTGLGFNKPSFGSTLSNPSLSSGGTGLNKPALSAKGSPTFGSSSSLGSAVNKPTSNVKISPSSGSTGSTGSTGKSASSSSGFSWLGFGSSNSGQSKTGSTGPGKGTSSGTGSLLGGGRTSGIEGGPVSVAQHLQDLQRLINPAGPEEKQGLSRMLG